ncbi:fumarylacetoacetate hydrolase family protein [Alteromonas sp. KS69]|jgi:2-keto-4-pentenoate hydratase/2-oxohepta-3-ene-1,7-dioic acid hydratase in catechol pathway|uniref:Fumarylacetoacetate hydrolase family protein n=1 Tax=Alteromonas naphthalenivorans TaxID=715451 RepID=F5ZB71_ALTNA|nr:MULTISPECIES: fumarylacetoacetate hydrolase family protein [Alteromonas]AEF02506.1 putative fumarylacetoacetate hydrolase family protein [Alteromonas naphthalenivorans]MBO7922861.1 fumarylacetoacetate hydrolase family protein [Alteromonas sp. K632G]RUP83818.1 fumarylacetoacetate hydrolase family protein [Alteromonas sp. KS69]|tara:strand:+ start:6735 stop:7397 length:663 start_codon:yes stop_codon:yes gene_type:complete
MYQHLDVQGNPIALPVGKVACIGRNYLDHIEEMKSVVSASPLLFLKPKAALCDMGKPLSIPTDQGECHNELEVAVLLKHAVSKATEDEVLAAIWGIGLGLDLTLRDVQRELKAQGQPWERAKSFDLSCPVSGFVPIDSITDLQDLRFTLSINGEVRQSGHTAMMLHKIVPLIAHMSQTFTLDAGDIVLTGTPKGVGPLLVGDTIEATLHDKITVNTKVVR